MNTLIIQLSEKPSFAGELVIQLCCCDEKNGAYILKCQKSPPPYDIVFHPKFDMQFGQLQWERKIKKEDTEKIIAAINSQKIGLSFKPVCGLDGTMFQLSVQGASNEVILKWFCYLPSEWSFLQDSIDLLLRLADQKSIIRESKKHGDRKTKN